MGLVLEQLNISVKQVTLSDVDATAAELVNKRKNSRSDGGFPDGTHGGEGANGSLILQHNTVKLRDVEVVVGRAGGYSEGEPISGEDGFGQREDDVFDGGLYGGEREVSDFTTGGGERRGDVGEGGGMGRGRGFEVGIGELLKGFDDFRVGFEAVLEGQGFGGGGCWGGGVGVGVVRTAALAGIRH